MSIICNYRNHQAGRKFYIRASRVTEPLGYLLKAVAGVVPVIERISFSAYVTATGDTNDIANMQLVTTDTAGNPVTPIAQTTVTTPTSPTVFTISASATLNEHAGRLVYMRSGAYAGQVRVIASNTAHATAPQITLSSALGGTPAASDALSILPRNTADAAWASTSIVPLWPSWRAQVTGAAQTVNFHKKDLNIRLGHNQGIGFFAFEHDNFVAPLDAVKWAEAGVVVAGRLEGIGAESYGNNFQFQPSGGM